jgi:flagellar biosynthesis protein FlhG
MTTIVPVASGKGGVGKTVLSANLGVALARAGKTVVLVDLDLGASNLHTVLGVKNRHPGVGNLIYKQEESLDSLLIETEERRLFLIPGDSLLPGTANLPYFRKQAIVKALTSLVADYVILDLGSGTAYNTVDFYLISSGGIVVTTPETTAILNAYSFIKTSIYRLLYRSFPHKSPERETVRKFFTQKIEGADLSVNALAQELGTISQEAEQTVRAQLHGFRPRVVINMAKAPEQIRLGARLREISRRNLDIEVEYVGFVMSDPLVPQSIFDRKPTIATHPTIPFSRAVTATAQKLITNPAGAGPNMFEDNEDLQEIAAHLPESQ